MLFSIIERLPQSHSLKYPKLYLKPNAADSSFRFSLQSGELFPHRLNRLPTVDLRRTDINDRSHHRQHRTDHRDQNYQILFHEFFFFFFVDLYNVRERKNLQLSKNNGFLPKNSDRFVRNKTKWLFYICMEIEKRQYRFLLSCHMFHMEEYIPFRILLYHSTVILSIDMI